MAGPINNAENQVDDALVNRLIKLERDFSDFKTTPQKIGNGSINYAVFSPFSVGPFTLPAGVTANITLTFMPIGSTFTYNGLPAINRATLIELLYSVNVDTNDTDHELPFGGSLTSGQKASRSSWWWSYNYSGLSETNGQRTMAIQVTNGDSVSHDYYVTGTALLPRPALKPQ